MCPLISVIVPIYNVQLYLKECVDSILVQTYKNLEIILIDDGSTDNSSKICDSFLSDKRVKVYHRQNKGLSSCRQFGIDNSNGTFFITIDSDDYIDAQCIDKLYNAICKSESDIAACCRYDFINGSPKLVPLKCGNNEVIATSKDYIAENLKILNQKVWLSDSWNKLYRTSFVRNSGVKFELNRRFNGNDFAFNYKLALHCPQYSVINEPLLYHRLTPNSMVRRKNKPLQEGFETVLSQIIAEGKICDYKNTLLKQFYFIYSNMLLLTAIDILKNYEDKDDLSARLSSLYKRDKSYRRSYPFLKKTIIKENFRTCLITLCIKYNLDKILFNMLLLSKRIL